MRVQKAGGAPATAGAGEDHPGAIVADAANYYWISEDGVQKIGK